MTIYQTFAPDPLWIGLAIAGVGSVVVGWLGPPRLGPSVSRWLVVAGLVLVAVLLAYSLLATWLAPIHGPT
jgi:hypothetical protein